MTTEIEIINAMTECLELFKKVKNPGRHTASYYANQIIVKINDKPFLSAYISYNPHRRAYVDRFTFDEELFDKLYPKKTQVEPFDDGINYSAPHAKGLYFVGQCFFNPYTDEKYYWVKIGRGIWLDERMSSYDTHTASLWRIDYSPNYENEKFYHNILKSICLNTHSHNKEWFRVDRDTYLAMCKQGFRYFS
jgi:hypothetical protein